MNQYLSFYCGFNPSNSAQVFQNHHSVLWFLQTYIRQQYSIFLKHNIHTILQSTRTLFIRCCTIFCVSVFDINYQRSKL